MTDQETNSELPTDMTPKQRLELERWARLNDMTPNEFLNSDLLQQLKKFRDKRLRNSEASAIDDEDALESHA